jgi:hypothetical protein
MSWAMVGVTLAVAAGAYGYLQLQMSQAREAQLKAHEKSVGQAMVGGPFTLTDCSGKPFPSSKLHGEFSILYFGFTHCPDVCPDELEKLAEAINLVGVASCVHTLAQAPAHLHLQGLLTWPLCALTHVHSSHPHAHSSHAHAHRPHLPAINPRGSRRTSAAIMHTQPDRCKPRTVGSVLGRPLHTRSHSRRAVAFVRALVVEHACREAQGAAGVHHAQAACMQRSARGTRCSRCSSRLTQSATVRSWFGNMSESSTHA